MIINPSTARLQLSKTLSELLLHQHQQQQLGEITTGSQ
jgi:hypothetical protein